MDPLVRRRRALLTVTSVALAAMLVACAGRDRGPAVGVSAKTAGGRSSRDAGDVGIIDGTAALPSNYRATFAKVNKARFVSQGHAPGRWDVDVWANEIAQKALAARAREVPPGAIVVQEHFERSALDPSSSPDMKGPIMVMEKRPPGFSNEHGDWRWAVIGSRGQLVRDGVIEQCAGCHDDAPMDGLFPIVE